MSFAQDLRASVLQAAMQGKLTEQLETDTPVSKLLADIKAEKDRLISEKKIKKEKPLSVIADDDIPFDIPESWEYVRVVDIVSNRVGLSYNKENLIKKSDNMVRVLRGGNIFDGTYNFKPDDVMIDSSFVKSELFLNKNTIITPAVTSLEHIGKMARIEKSFTDTVVGGFVLMLTPHLDNDILSQYLLFVFLEPSFRDRCRNITNKSGQAFYNLSRQKLMELVIPIPPIEEQKRIVQRIEEIMNHIDELEAIEEELKKLKEVFPADMKAAVLQAAMQGKLTEQLDTDGSVDELLENIKTEREKLVKEGKIKKGKMIQNNNFVAFSNSETSFEIPDNWRWARLSQIAKSITAGGDKPNDYSHLKTEKCIYPVFANGETNDGLFGFTSENRIKERALTVSGRGTIGFTRVREPNFTPIVRLLVITLIEDTINFEFLAYALNHLMETGVGSAIKQFTVPMIIDKLIPLPPLEEQNRIVTKLEQILPLIANLP